MGIPCSSASPPSSRMRVDDAPGLADHPLPLAAHQNHPGEAADPILCPRSFPHQASSVEPFTRFQERKRKKKPQQEEPCGQQLPGGKAIAQPSPVLVAPFLPGGAPGWHHSHPHLPWGCSSQLWFPQAGLGGADGAGIVSPTIPTPWAPHHAPTLPLATGAWHLPSSHLSSSPGISMPFGRGIGKRHPGSSLATQLSHRLCFLSSLWLRVEFSSPSILILRSGNLWIRREK